MGKPYDFKQAYKDLYRPGSSPMAVTVPPMRFIAVDGAGDPDGEEYQRAVELLYALCYTVKMSKLGGDMPEGYFDYVVPPLEGLWDCGRPGYDPNNRGAWRWTSMIRQPEFVTPAVFARACEKVAAKKPGLAIGKARLWEFEEGLCVQILHTGPFCTEPQSVAMLDAFAAANGLAAEYDSVRRHHELYLSDPRRTAPETLKTVLRHPVRRA